MKNQKWSMRRYEYGRHIIIMQSTFLFLKKHKWNWTSSQIHNRWNPDYSENVNLQVKNIRCVVGTTDKIQNLASG